MGNPVAQNVFEDGRETTLMRWSICLISVALLCSSAYKNVIKNRIPYSSSLQVAAEALPMGRRCRRCWQRYFVSSCATDGGYSWETGQIALVLVEEQKTLRKKAKEAEGSRTLRPDIECLCQCFSLRAA